MRNLSLIAFILANLALACSLPPKQSQSHVCHPGCGGGSSFGGFGYTHDCTTGKTYYMEGPYVVPEEYWRRKYTRRRTTTETIQMVWELHLDRLKKFILGQ